MKEVSTMFSFKHPNVMSLIGVCLEEETPLVIMPFMVNGSVLEFVRRNRESLHCISLSEVCDDYYNNNDMQQKLYAGCGLCQEGVFGYVSSDQ